MVRMVRSLGAPQADCSVYFAALQQNSHSHKQPQCIVARRMSDRKGENTYRGALFPAACHLRDSAAGAADYITRASAAATAPMLRLLMAATQMRPESTP